MAKYGRGDALYKEYTMDTLSDLDRVHKDQSYFWVDAALNTSAVTAWGGSRLSNPKPTLASAHSACTASRGDHIYVSPFHTETVTAVLTMNLIGVQIIGKKLGNQRPVISVNGTVDMFSIEAAGCGISGLECTIVTTDAATAIVNIASNHASVRDLYIIPSATSINVTDVFTVTADGDDSVIGGSDFERDGITIYNKTVAVNSFLSFEGAVSNFRVQNLRAFGDCATAGIIDGAKVDYLVLEDVQVAVVGTTIPAATLDSNPEGMARNCFFAGTHGTLATNANLGNLMRLDNVKVLEETDGSVSAAIIPAVDSD